ncbi:triacylglycerol lipase [Massilia sp. erpn]|uniref:esterase/lipase family protein n=1 Tax=Massilia sp. erpn TaxID=2738142 RepID=UPI00210810D2|nr:GPI inositol-deacylase [Massilia sp. erpn]UTY59342.1 hypothetical protein HPQ68_20465 [Massilia sp. erpn]
MAEPTRPLRDPTVTTDGDLLVVSHTSHESFKTRGMATIPSRFVIPVIFVPGIMGTNLRAKVSPGIEAEKNLEIALGAPAWRMPNGSVDGIREAGRWKERKPQQRQRILDAATLEVDDGGDIVIPPCSLDPREMCKRGWGELHAASYSQVLYTLQSHLDYTFRLDGLGKRQIRGRWKRVMECDPQRWGMQSVAPLTEAELDRFARFQYPVYACGYNWLESCAKSADRLEKKIREVIAFWVGTKHVCTQVILVTHSMGGLVARACAKRIPDQIAGVVHGVMPALGAPVCYRRIACGTEHSSPVNDRLENFVAGKFAEIVGETPEATTPVMAVAPGVLELLPNHLHPPYWLTAGMSRRSHSPGAPPEYMQHLQLPRGGPYDLYRDLKSWYRVINPDIADPAGAFQEHPGDVINRIIAAINDAEHFHRQGIDTYYHPRSYAFYGADPEHISYGSIRWVGHQPDHLSFAITTSAIEEAKFLSHTHDGRRNVAIGGRTFLFLPEQQDVSGDGTVSCQSGAGPKGKVRQLFEARGFGHQDGFKNEDMLLLTQYLIAKIVQEVK